MYQIFTSFFNFDFLSSWGQMLGLSPHSLADSHDRRISEWSLKDGKIHALDESLGAASGGRSPVGLILIQGGKILQRTRIPRHPKQQLYTLSTERLT
jgi:hypothetical protein